MEEIVQSLRSRELILRNPSLRDELDADKGQSGDLLVERQRREVLPTSADGSDPNLDDGQAPSQSPPYLGPFSYFSGKHFSRFDLDLKPSTKNKPAPPKTQTNLKQTHK